MPTLQLSDDAQGKTFFVGDFTDGENYYILVWDRPPTEDQLYPRPVPIKPWNQAVSAPQGGDVAFPHPNPLKFRNKHPFCATYRHGFIYLAFGDSAPSGTKSIEAMRVLRIPVRATTPEELIDPANGFIDRRLPDNVGELHYGWPALTATEKDDMVLAYQRTSQASFPEVRYNVWPATASSPQPSHTLKSGEMPFIDQSADQGAAVGDYDMVNIAPDPDGTSVWIAHPYPFKPGDPATVSKNYRLVVGRVVP